MADKINWLPAAIGAAVTAGLVATRVPNAGRNTLGAAALVGGAVGYGIADFLEDRSIGKRLGRAAKKASAGVRKAGGKAKDAVKGAGRAVKNAPKRAKAKAKSARKKAAGWFKRRF